MRRAPGRGRDGAARATLALALLAALGAAMAAGCAKKEPPSGGPPDIVPPRLVSSAPDSGAAGVPRDVRPSLTFSEGMEPRSTGDAVSFAPPIEIRQRRWSGRTLTLVLGDTLRHDHTYTLFVAGSARDRHGNYYGTGKAVVFSTGPAFPPGAISGELETRGMSPGGCVIWCYDQTLGHRPDSTARDFDALGVAQEDGSFSIVGLKVPGTYRLWVFADLNNNRSFEPQSDVLAAIDTTFQLTLNAPRPSEVHLLAINPRAPGTVAGTVLDSVADSSGAVYAFATSSTDSTKRVLAEVGRDGTFLIQLDAGTWLLRAFRDLNSDRGWQPARERASEREVVTLPPAGAVVNLKLVLRRGTGGP